jgi:hypothetical protein
MRKLIAAVALIGSVAMGEYTEEQLVSHVQRPLTPAEIVLMPYLDPVYAKINGERVPVLVFEAFMEVPKYLNIDIPARYTEQIHGYSVPLHLNEFALTYDDMGDTFIFSLAANYGLNPSRVRYDYMTAEDGMDWVVFIEAMGYSRTNLLTKQQRQQRIQGL